LKATHFFYDVREGIARNRFSPLTFFDPIMRSKAVFI
jgi:hypothetical protein